MVNAMNFMSGITLSNLHSISQNRTVFCLSFESVLSTRCDKKVILSCAYPEPVASHESHNHWYDFIQESNEQLHSYLPNYHLY